MPLRHEELPRHDARPETLTTPMEQEHSHIHWGAEALWQQLEPLLPGAPED